MAAGSGDIRAGGAYVELGAKDGALRKALDASAARVKAWGASIASIGTGVATLAATALTPFIAAAATFAETGKSLSVAAAKTGLSVEAVSELGYAAQRGGGSVEDLEKALFALQRKTVEAADGSVQADEALARLGVTVETLAGLKPDQQLALIANGVAAIKSPAERTAAVMAALSESGVKMIPALMGGAKGLAALRQEARDLGVSVSTKDAQAAVELSAAWDKVTAVLKAVVFQVGAALAPTLTDLLEVVKGYAVSIRNWVVENQGLIVSVAKAIPLVAAVGAGIVAAGYAVSAMGTAVSVLSTALGLVAGAFGLLLSPIGLVTAAVVGVGAAWFTLTDDGKRAAGDIAGAWSWMGKDFKGVWGSIVEAVQAGDLEKALRVVTASLSHLWAGAILGLSESWNAFVMNVGRTLRANPWILSAAGIAGGALAGGAVGSVIPGVGTAIGAGVGGLAGGIGGALASGQAESAAGGVMLELSAMRARMAATELALREAINDPVRRAQARAAMAASGGAAGQQMFAMGGSRGTFDARNAAGTLGISDQVRRMVDAAESTAKSADNIDRAVKRLGEVS